MVGIPYFLIHNPTLVHQPKFIFELFLAVIKGTLRLLSKSIY